MEKKRIIVLGASGVIGKNCIDIIRSFPDLFTLAGVSVHSDINALAALRKEFALKCFTVSDQSKAFTEGFASIEELLEKTPADVVINGIAGSAGLAASFVAVKTHPVLGLANKESIVMAGSLLQAYAVRQHNIIIPVDSEHSALYTLIHAHGKNAVARLVLTASGGAFRTASADQIKEASIEAALCHPTWIMGKKITVDSASLANKALEIIEAVSLFNMPAENITVTVHPESIVHSMVQLKSGVVYAELSPPDMRNPLFTALQYPKIPPPYLEPLDFSKTFCLHFEPPRADDFPLLSLGFVAAKKQGGYPIAFNAANEQAVFAFIDGRLMFPQLADVTAEVLQHDWTCSPQNLAGVLDIDRHARYLADAIIQKSTN